jgi:hypothetical protein
MRRQAGIGMEEEEDVTRGSRCARVHLTGPTALRHEHPVGALACLHGRVIVTAAINDNDLRTLRTQGNQRA